MNNKIIAFIIASLLILPAALGQVKVQLGEQYINLEQLSGIDFMPHSGYYEICSLDNTVIPVLIKNGNNFSDSFTFKANKEYASLPVESAVINSGKSVILPLTLNPPAGSEANTTLILDIITKKEGLKRSVVINTNIEDCYKSSLEISEEEDELCGCDEKAYLLTLTNNGRTTDTFALIIDAPKWINSTLGNDTITLYDGQKKEIRLSANPPCDEKGSFTVNVKAVSGKSRLAAQKKLELNVLPIDECYNTEINALNADLDYFGKNIPITIKNKGAKDADYSIIAEGIDWYKLSQTELSLKKNSEKTINLALYPSESIAEGKYNVEIKAKSGEKEFTKSITVSLKRKGALYEKIKFYLNYFRYYIGLGVALLIVLIIIIRLIKKRRMQIKEKKRIEKEKEKEAKKEQKIEKKEAFKKAKAEREALKWVIHVILSLVSTGLLVLLTYSTFKYRAFYEKVLGIISQFFMTYIFPYLFYLKYVVVVVGAIISIRLILDLFMRRPAGKEVKTKAIDWEERQEKKAEAKRVIAKKTNKKKKGFEHVYFTLVILLFIAIVVYSLYRFYGKDWFFGKIMLARDFILKYPYYFIAGAAAIALLIAIIIFFRKRGKKRSKARKKEEKKAAMKSRLPKKLKKVIRNFLITVVGLIVLSGIVYSFIYYKLFGYIKDFFIVYYPYVLMGIGILIIVILILHFHSRKIS